MVAGERIEVVQRFRRDSGGHHEAESLGMQGTRMRGENKLEHPAQKSRARRSGDAGQQPRPGVGIVGCEPQIPKHRDECDALQQLTDRQDLRELDPAASSAPAIEFTALITAKSQRSWRSVATSAAAMKIGVRQRCRARRRAAKPGVRRAAASMAGADVVGPFDICEPIGITGFQL